MSLFCAHVWEAVSFNHLRWERSYPETLVFYVCRECGRHRTDTLKGIWPADTLGIGAAK